MHCRHCQQDFDNEIEFLVHNAIRQDYLMEALMIDLTAERDATAHMTTVVESVKTLLGGLSAKISDLAAQLASEPKVQAELNDLAATLNATADDAAAAVVANTPADTTPPVVAEPPPVVTEPPPDVVPNA